MQEKGNTGEAKVCKQGPTLATEPTTLLPAATKGEMFNHTRNEPQGLSQAK